MIRRVPLWAWGLGAVALGLRLAGLGHPQAIAFDETYYVPFALNYLKGTPSFDAHPPLAKYLIALGLWLGQWPAAWLGWPTVEVDGAWVSPLAFRWLNAVVGATVPLLLAAIAWELGGGGEPTQSTVKRETLNQPITPLFKGGRGDRFKAGRENHFPLRQRFALLAGLLMAMEGLTLVESRLALINIYGLALGLLGQWAWLRARHSPQGDRWRWVAGIAFGAAINVKWNWAGLWLGVVLWEAKRRGRGMRANLAYLGILPLLTYLVLWIPHLVLTGESLLGVHQQIWAAHQSIGQNASHDYCSPWYSWPLLVRPIAYFYNRVGQGETATATAIHAMGNPVLWWLGTAAIIALGLGWLARSRRSHPQTAAGNPDAVVSFILLNYLANWLPWALVGRCTFFYHALGIAAFSTLGLAWLMAQWLGQRQHRAIALGLLGAIALGFWFWLPLYLGLPLSPEALQRRWLLPGWI